MSYSRKQWPNTSCGGLKLLKSKSINLPKMLFNAPKLLRISDVEFSVGDFHITTAVIRGGIWINSMYLVQSNMSLH